MVSKKDLTLSVLTVSFLATALFSTVWIAGSAGDWDPWMDVDDNGIVNMLDLYKVAQKYGTTGTALDKASIEYDSGWTDVTDKRGQYFSITHNLDSMNVIVDIQGKTTTDGGVHQRTLGGIYSAEGWHRIYGVPSPPGAHAGTNMEGAHSVIKTLDNGHPGYAMAGYLTTYYETYYFYLVKTDSSGNMEWNKTYGTGGEEAQSLVQDSDGGYVLAGYTFNGAGGTDIWLVKTYSEGTMLFERTYGGTNLDSANSVVVTGNGYALAGSTGSYGAGGSDMWLVKTDENGNHMWNKTYGGANTDTAYSMIRTDDGGYALGGMTSSYGAEEGDFWLVKTDSSGNVQWNRTYGGAGNNVALSIVQADDMGYVLAGFTWPDLAEYRDLYLVKTDAVGNMQWNKTYGGEDDEIARSVIQTADGGYAIVGQYSETYAWLVKTDSDGDVQWKKTYESGSFHSVVQTDDGRYVMAGSGGFTGDAWLVESDVESGLAWTSSTANTITLYRGVTDPYWNFVRVRIWKPKNP